MLLTAWRSTFFFGGYLIILSGTELLLPWLMILVRISCFLPEAVVYVISPFGVMIMSYGLGALTPAALASPSYWKPSFVSKVISGKSFSFVCSWMFVQSGRSIEVAIGELLACISNGSCSKWLLLWLGSMILPGRWNGALLICRSSMLVSFCKVVSLAEASFSLSNSGFLFRSCLLCDC